MFACLGYIVPEYFRWPGYLSPEKGIKFADVPAGLAAVSKVPLEGWAQIALFLGHYEGYFWRQDAKRAPGDYEGGELKYDIMLQVILSLALLHAYSGYRNL